MTCDTRCSRPFDYAARRLAGAYLNSTMLSPTGRTATRRSAVGRSASPNSRSPAPRTYGWIISRTSPTRSFEAISLAFVTALQLLAPRQLAALVLRDVRGFPAAEVAEMLDSTVQSVNSALKRARAAVARRRSAGAEQAPVAGSPAEEAFVAAFVRAYGAGDIDALVAPLTDDVFVSMPPMAFEYEGRAAAQRFCDLILRDGRTFDLVPTRAHGQPAFGLYRHAPDGRRHAAGLLVLTLAGDHVSAMTRFENGLLPWFGLPRTLPPR